MDKVNKTRSIAVSDINNLQGSQTNGISGLKRLIKMTESIKLNAIAEE